MRQDCVGAQHAAPHFSWVERNSRVSSSDSLGVNGYTVSSWGAALLRPYSTVTDFARFRGWSTSQPRRTAM
jgi:hypothetical protein